MPVEVESEAESEPDESESALHHGCDSTYRFDPSCSMPPARRRVEIYERDHWPADHWITDSDDSEGQIPGAASVLPLKHQTDLRKLTQRSILSECDRGISNGRQIAQLLHQGVFGIEQSARTTLVQLDHFSDEPIFAESVVQMGLYAD